MPGQKIWLMTRAGARGYRATALLAAARLLQAGRAGKTPKTGVSGTTNMLPGFASFHRNHNILSRPKKATGFTLVEVLVSIAIMSILGLSLTAILRASVTAWREGEARTDTTATARTAMDQLCGDFAAAFTKNIRPPGPVTIEIPTVKDLADRGLDYFSNEWCTISADEAPTIDHNNPQLGILNTQLTLHFRLRFTTKRARFWIATYGNVELEARAFKPGDEDDTSSFGNDIPPSGNLSDIIEADTTENGTVYVADHIAIRAATEAEPDARLMPGSEGPVLRFTAEPDRASPGDVRFLLWPPAHDPQPQAQKVVFIKNLSHRPDPFAADSDGRTGLAEVCYITTFNEVRPGELSPTGTLWRAVRNPIGNWPGPEGQDPSLEDWSLFNLNCPFIVDITELATEAEGPGGETIKVYTRQAMQAAGFYPIAENVLYFAVQAWNADPEWLTWVNEWGAPGAPAGIPSKIRVVLTLLPQTSQRTVACLAEDLDAETETPEIVLDSAKGFRPFAAGSPLERFVKIGDEWICYDDVREARKLVFDTRGADEAAGNEQFALLYYEPDRPREGNRNGLRSSASVGHEAGADVYQGDTYVRTIVLPYPKQPDTEDAAP